MFTFVRRFSREIKLHQQNFAKFIDIKKVFLCKLTKNRWWSLSKRYSLVSIVTRLSPETSFVRATLFEQLMEVCAFKLEKNWTPSEDFSQNHFFASFTLKLFSLQLTRISGLDFFLTRLIIQSVASNKNEKKRVYVLFHFVFDFNDLDAAHLRNKPSLLCRQWCLYWFPLGLFRYVYIWYSRSWTLEFP